MIELFDEYRRGDEANCFYCGAWLSWDDMRPSAWGPQYRENVCVDCRNEEIENGGWMLRDAASVKARQERRFAHVSDMQQRPLDASLDVRKLAPRHRVEEARRVGGSVTWPERGGKVRHALRRLRRTLRIS